jgi:small-conductance mechanosensitive channel
MSIEQLSSKFLINSDKFWHYVIITASSKEIKVANVTLAIIAIYCSSKYYHQILAFLANKIITTPSDENRLIIEKLLSIVLALVLIILILQISNVPLDTFAFLGGAFVLGFGLGIQALINNMLSSLILIIEKPFKIGDNITVDNYQGTVEAICNRTIKIRNSINALVTIPSSAIAQSKLINWTDSQFLIYDVRIKVPKKIDQEHDIVGCCQIIEDAIPAKLRFHAPCLISSTIAYYVYELKYKAFANTNVLLLKHKVSLRLIGALGQDIVLEYSEKQSPAV